MRYQLDHKNNYFQLYKVGSFNIIQIESGNNHTKKHVSKYGDFNMLILVDFILQASKAHELMGLFVKLLAWWAM